MFAKAKRFGDAKNEAKEKKSAEPDTPKIIPKTSAVNSALTKPKPRTNPAPNIPRSRADSQSQCSSVRSVKSFVTPKPVKPPLATKCSSSLKKAQPSKKNADPTISDDKKVAEDIIKSQEVEIRNKDYTIAEYFKQIDELKNEITNLQKQQGVSSDCRKICDNLQKQMSEIYIGEKHSNELDDEHDTVITDLKFMIASLEEQCNRLEHEISSKQVELSSLEELICIRDSLCKDLQDKLTNVETTLDETRQRLEMVKGHHLLALEANESIRREYKAELETMKLKLEEEKQTIISKFKNDQETLKTKYTTQMQLLKKQLIKENDQAVSDLQQKIKTKEIEMKAKLEQIDEATSEKLKLCEIQFEERFRGFQEHWALQDEKIQFLEKEAAELKYAFSLAEEQGLALRREIKSLQNKNETLTAEKSALMQQLENLKEESKKKFIDFDNQINKLTVEVDKAVKEKNKFEMSLTVTRDIVQVLTMRLRESDNEVEHLEEKVQALSDDNEQVRIELENYKDSLNSTVIECNEYKEALVNILKSKAALAAEHSRIMEHNASLAESLQQVEQEAYRELGCIKSELVEDVETLKKESSSQIQSLREEVERKRAEVSVCTEAMGAAAAAAEASRGLLARAAADLERREAENRRLARQIQDQQSLVVELSLLRQENEELSMTLATQRSLLDQLKADQLLKPKSPALARKNHKMGKENAQIIISPLRERNHI